MHPHAEPHPIRQALRRETYQRVPDERHHLAKQIAERADLPIAALGVVLVLLVIAERSSEPRGSLADVFHVATALLFLAVVGEFALRVAVAPHTKQYLRHHWWELILVPFPFLRAVRGVRHRLTTGHVASSAIHASRTAVAALTSRVGWLTIITAIVILGSGQVLYGISGLGYGRALHDAALGAISGNPVSSDESTAQTLDVVLSLYSALVFAALAGTLGVFWLEHRQEAKEQHAAAQSIAP
jgi:voltage-gated potassium channel